MNSNRLSHSTFAAAALGIALLVGPAVGQGVGQDDVERLLGELARPDQPDWAAIEQSILEQWSRSGSPAMDLLLERGMKALAAGDTGAALDHLRALTDHAPDFAEAWNVRATVFYALGETGPALEDIRHTLLLNPRHFGALIGLATILEEMGREAEALEAWRAVEAIHPHSPELHEAIDRLEKIVEGERL